MIGTGERQVAPDASGIRRDHVARYEFAATVLPPGTRVLDLACGVGYGAKILAEAGMKVQAADISVDAIEYARANYWHENISYWVSDVAAAADGAQADAVVCFETLEHLDDPVAALRAFRNTAKLLLASVPNEERFPYRGQKFHKRHYTRQEFADLLASAGWKVAHWYGQETEFSEVVDNVNGRTCIVMAGPGNVGEYGEPVPETTGIPHHVAILGLGPSIGDFVELTKTLGGRRAYCDEVWGINAIGDVVACDLIFHMDDMQVQEARAAARPGSNIDAIVKWLRTYPGPVITSRVRPGYPNHQAFPLEDVLNGGYDGAGGGPPYFNSTAAYAVAYAIHIGVKRISLFGIDYTLPNVHHAEKGRACVEFWLGIATARGIEITVPDRTSLLDACEPEASRLYGYDCVDVVLNTRPDGKLDLTFTEKAETVDAAEIERRYDHKKHPNPLMRRAEE